MNLAAIEETIEFAILDAEATVTQPRGPDDEDHLAATVVSPAFEGETLVVVELPLVGTVMLLKPLVVTAQRSHLLALR